MDAGKDTTTKEKKAALDEFQKIAQRLRDRNAADPRGHCTF